MSTDGEEIPVVPILHPARVPPVFLSGDEDLLLEEEVQDDDATSSSDFGVSEESVESVEEFDVDHAGFEDAAGDFTKRYNRLRQHVAASTQSKTTTALPAVNRPVKHLDQPAVRSTSKAAIHGSKVDSSLASLAPRYAALLNLDPVSRGGSTRKGGSEPVQVLKDKSDRATNEQVLDDRTRLVLYKMLNRHLLTKIEGCVSTGKEANVYHALGPVDPENDETSPERHLALKVYKTSILIFKDRDRYVTGEYRFKSGYAKSNPRKMVRLWAEKELRNLRRLATADIPCPRAIEVRNNVLVMEYLGQSDDEWQASPRLKDAEIPEDHLHKLYMEMLYLIVLLFHRCKLVHADLSEYNILYHRGSLYLIDVSQSVEHDHPHALDFLRTDLSNVDTFFARRGVRTLGLKRTFDLVSSRQFYAEHFGSEQTGKAAVSVETERLLALPEEAEDAAFKESYIPRTLNEVYDAERDVDVVRRGQGDQLIYAGLTGVASVNKPNRTMKEGSDDGSEVSGSESDLQTSDSDEADRGGGKFADREANKDRKKAVKEARREKRLTKVPKKVKQKAIKKTSGRR